jgi:hypothetical protein
MKRAIVQSLLFVALFVGYSLWAHAAEVEPVVIYDHTSALSRGYPFNDQEEWTVDFLGAGITIKAGTRRAWEIDLAHGRKQFDNNGAWEEGSKLAVRWYPRRGR